MRKAQKKYRLGLVYSQVWCIQKNRRFGVSQVWCIQKTNALVYTGVENCFLGFVKGTQHGPKQADYTPNTLLYTKRDAQLFLAKVRKILA